MKTLRLSTLSVLICLSTGCSTAVTRRLDGSHLAPAARGTVRIEKTESGEIFLNLKVEHLAPAQRVSKGASTYVVWLQPTVGESKPFRNLGVLPLDSDLSGEFSTLLRHRNFNLVITPEVSATVNEPLNTPVLSVALSPMIRP